jgi:hypothetical protein
VWADRGTGWPVTGVLVALGIVNLFPAALAACWRTGRRARDDDRRWCRRCWWR